MAAPRPAAVPPARAELMFDWNATGPRNGPPGPGFTLLDETLRDGLQTPSARTPTTADKLELVHRMNDLGISAVNVGIPGSSPRVFRDALRLCREIAGARLAIKPVCAGRTVLCDIEKALELVQRAGVEAEIYVFIGSSAIRRLVENWTVELLAERAAAAIDLVVKAGLPAVFVTEDTTRSHPEVLSHLFKVAIDRGASRLCLCDTAGHATHEGVRGLVGFARSVIDGMGATGRVGIDWHGHNDRGLALSNCLHALACGADRVHATALGMGERVGNVPMELLLLNLRLSGLLDDHDLSRLGDYCEVAARSVGWPVPINYPLVGRDAFRTATGVHASAIMKAQAKGDAWLADRVYSSVPASLVGRHQEIVIGPGSGMSNVVHVLHRLGIEPMPDLVYAVLRVAKEADQILSDDDVREAVAQATRIHDKAPPHAAPAGPPTAETAGDQHPPSPPVA
jgi:isopropylmalate/homocitrate/citramalate synthase